MTSIMTMPEVQYATEFTPVSDDGWYYYVADYNEWRVNQGA